MALHAAIAEQLLALAPAASRDDSGADAQPGGDGEALAALRSVVPERELDDAALLRGLERVAAALAHRVANDLVAGSPAVPRQLRGRCARGPVWQPCSPALQASLPAAPVRCT